MDGTQSEGLQASPKGCGRWRRGQCSDVGEGRADVAMGARERPSGRTCSDRRQAAVQSSKSAGSDWSNTNSGMGSAWVGSKAGPWLRKARIFIWPPHAGHRSGSTS
jgi:hypothetical protein